MVLHTSTLNSLNTKIIIIIIIIKGEGSSKEWMFRLEDNGDAVLRVSVMVRVSASEAVGCGFDPEPHTKDVKIGTSGYFAWHSALYG